MIIGREALVEEFVVHRLGAERTDSVYSDFTVTLKSDVEQEFLRKLFLKPFAQMATTSEFTHPVALEYNVLNGLCEGLRNGQDLLEGSLAIARHLLDVSEHHNIKGGDLFVVRFTGVGLAAAVHDAIGIYKFDEKEIFIESRTEAGLVELRMRKGIGSRKPDKACLVVNTLGGPTLFVLDDNEYTGYWQKDFIGHRPKNDHVNSTNNLLDLTRSFITAHLPQEQELDRADQIDLLNRSVAYFKEHDEFIKDEFVKEVFQEEEAIRSFNDYSQEFQRNNDIELQDSFEISTHAVRKQARVFKSVIKLDRNFHIYVHGDRDRIERGVDEKGRKYYKIYYDEES